MKKILITISFILSISVMLFNSCAPTKAIADKSGAQLWGENCNRCHSAPSKDQYAKEKWDLIGTHMKLKAGITDAEITKIVAYLKDEQQ